jgi:predicted  nucleic acid-binding Zn-ribbon protein
MLAATFPEMFEDEQGGYAMSEEILKQILVTVGKLDSRMERMESRMDSMESTMERMESRMDGMESKMERIESRMDGMESKMERMESRMDGMESRMERMESRMDGMESRMDGMESTMERMESRMDGMESKIEGIESQMEGMGTKIEGLESRMEAMESNVGNLTATVATKSDTDTIGQQLSRLENKLDSYHSENIVTDEKLLEGVRTTNDKVDFYVNHSTGELNELQYSIDVLQRNQFRLDTDLEKLKRK